MENLQNLISNSFAHIIGLRNKKPGTPDPYTMYGNEYWSIDCINKTDP